jgi:hypothetical protein
LFGLTIESELFFFPPLSSDYYERPQNLSLSLKKKFIAYVATPTFAIAITNERTGWYIHHDFDDKIHYHPLEANGVQVENIIGYWAQDNRYFVMGSINGRCSLFAGGYNTAQQLGVQKTHKELYDESCHFLSTEMKIVDMIDTKYLDTFVLGAHHAAAIMYYPPESEEAIQRVKQERSLKYVATFGDNQDSQCGHPRGGYVLRPFDLSKKYSLSDPDGIACSTKFTIILSRRKLYLFGGSPRGYKPMTIDLELRPDRIFAGAHTLMVPLVSGGMLAFNLELKKNNKKRVYIPHPLKILPRKTINQVYFNTSSIVVKASTYTLPLRSLSDNLDSILGKRCRIVCNDAENEKKKQKINL